MKSLMKFSWVALAAVARYLVTTSEMAGSAAPARELVVAGSTRSSDGSGVGKKSLGEMDAMSS